MDSVKNKFDDLSILDERKHGGKMDKRRRRKADEESDDQEEDGGSASGDGKFKSKNLNAERKRRKRLSDRQLELRAIVPIITNMNKATIITDAVTYIEELQKTVKDLSDQLMQMDATCVKDENKEVDEIDHKSEMEKFGIKPEVQVIDIDGRKLWIKVVFEKKRGGITRLIEAMNVLGFDLTNTSITTSGGAVLFTSSVEGIRDGMEDAEQIKEFLLEIIHSI